MRTPSEAGRTLRSRRAAVSTGLSPSVAARAKWSGPASGSSRARANAQDVRGELGTTVTELAARLDVPTRVRGRIAQIRLAVLTTARAHTELVAGSVAVVLFVLVARRIHRSSRRSTTVT